MKHTERLSRREFTAAAAGVLASSGLAHVLEAARKRKPDFALRYILASPMYGYTRVEEIFPEVKKTGGLTRRCRLRPLAPVEGWVLMASRLSEHEDGPGEPPVLTAVHPAFQTLFHVGEVRLGDSPAKELGLLLLRFA